jgi:hypothetical protein
MSTKDRPRLPPQFSNRPVALHRDADDTLAGWQRFAEEHPEAIVRAEAELQRRRWQPAEASWTYVVTDDNGQRREVSRAEHARHMAERRTDAVTTDWKALASIPPERTPVVKNKRTAEAPDPLEYARSLARRALAEEAAERETAKLRAEERAAKDAAQAKKARAELARRMHLDPAKLEAAAQALALDPVEADRRQVVAARQVEREAEQVKADAAFERANGKPPGSLAKHRAEIAAKRANNGKW